MTAENVGPTVMIVDDDTVDLMQYERLFQQHGGYGTILTFSLPEEALFHFADDRGMPIDFLLLDVVMPTMSGFKFLESAIETYGPRFVRSTAMMTGVALSRDHLQRASSHEVVRAFFRKPLALTDLDEGLAILAADGLQSA